MNEDDDLPLTPEEEALKREFEEEDEDGEPLDFPDYVPLPVNDDDVVAEIVPTPPQRGN